MKNHAALIIQDQKKVLFVQRSATKKTLPNIWAFPSGTIEEGETVEMTAKREAKEELGIDIAIKRVLTTTELPEFGVRLHFLICTSKSQKPTICEPDEIQALRWMTLKDFFDEYPDKQIGHGLIYLRKHPEVWEEYL